jgi:hypothetical protein
MVHKGVPPDSQKKFEKRVTELETRLLMIRNPRFYTKFGNLTLPRPDRVKQFWPGSHAGSVATVTQPRCIASIYILQ